MKHLQQHNMDVSNKLGIVVGSLSIGSREFVDGGTKLPNMCMVGNSVSDVIVVHVVNESFVIATLRFCCMSLYLGYFDGVGSSGSNDVICNAPKISIIFQPKVGWSVLWCQHSLNTPDNCEIVNSNM